MIKDIEFRGKKFKIHWFDTYPNHASLASFYDEVSVKDEFWHINENDTVLDIGSAFGSYALTALSQGAKFVWAWSPQGYPSETEQEVLQKSVQENGWSDRCVVYGSGIYSETGYLHTIDQRIIESVDDEFSARTTGNCIPVEPLDVWAERELSENDRIDWMKLDVEGAEVEVLKSGENLIRKFTPKILVENHVFKNSNIDQEVKNFILGLDVGYVEVKTIPYTESISHSLYSVQ